MQGFPFHETYREELPFCWIYTDVSSMGYFISPLALLAVATTIVKAITWKVLKKGNEQTERDFSYQEAHLSFMASITIIPTVMIGWALLSVGVHVSGNIQNIILVCAPTFNILVGFQIIYFYFYRNYWVIKAISEESRIREMKKLKNFSFLKDLPLQVQYKPGKYDHFDEDEDDTFFGAQPSTTSLSADLLAFT